jgi:hypothetical protein
MDEIIIEFNPSAFKHGIGEEDIRTAIEQFTYNEIMEDDAEKHLLLGFDTHANLLEIIYNVRLFQNFSFWNSFLRFRGKTGL